jgi:hypothetical protein
MSRLSIFLFHDFDHDLVSIINVKLGTLAVAVEALAGGVTSPRRTMFLKKPLSSLSISKSMEILKLEG